MRSAPSSPIERKKRFQKQRKHFKKLAAINKQVVDAGKHHGLTKEDFEMKMQTVQHKLELHLISKRFIRTWITYVILTKQLKQFFILYRMMSTLRKLRNGTTFLNFLQNKKKSIFVFVESGALCCCTN